MSSLIARSSQHKQRGLSTRTLMLSLGALAVLGALAAGLRGTLGVSTGDSSGESAEAAGERLFERLACGTCHGAQPGARGPALTGLFGSQVTLQSGVTIQADEAYVGESIMNPGAKVLAGYDPIMPVYQGQIDEEGLRQLTAYIRSLRVSAAASATPEGGENER